MRVCEKAWKRATAALTLDTIPEECLFAILARLSATQLSQARLACRALAAVGKRPDLPPRQEQLQLALTALGDDSLLVLGVRQRRSRRMSWGQLLQRPGARETLRHMAALELLVAGKHNRIKHFREMFQDVASCLEGGGAALRALRLKNLRVLDDGAAALGEGGSAALLRGLHHLHLEE